MAILPPKEAFKTKMLRESKICNRIYELTLNKNTFIKNEIENKVLIFIKYLII